MAKQQSKEVQRAVSKLYARMAQKAAARALEHAAYDREGTAEDTAEWVERFLTKAGARATSLYFNC